MASTETRELCSADSSYSCCNLSSCWIFFFSIGCPSSLLWLKDSRKWCCITFVTPVFVFHLVSSSAWQVRSVSQMFHRLLCYVSVSTVPTDLQPLSNLSIPHRVDQAQLNSLADSLIYPGGNCPGFQLSSSILPLNKCLLFLDCVPHV